MPEDSFFFGDRYFSGTGIFRGLAQPKGGACPRVSPRVTEART